MQPIKLTVNTDDISSIAMFVAEGLNKGTMRSFEFHGTVTASDVERAFAKSEWLQRYLQTAIDAALDALPKSVLTERNDIASLPYDTRKYVDGFAVGIADACDLDHFDDVPNGCYCSECHKEAVAKWSYRCDAFVPTCHPKGELTHDIAHHKVMENGDAVEFAEDRSADAYRLYCQVLRDTEMEHS